ncbi:MAG: cyclase family protein [Burkholderiaceae bacterium]|nr:cyclase family protein [Burkholderiaceae bacterium]
MTSRRWTQRPAGSTWGDFGADDQLGRLNLLTPERRRAAAAEVREGLAFCLSLPLDYPGGSVLNPRRKPPLLQPTTLRGQPFMNQALRQFDARNTDIICDDQVTMSLQYSTQWDSFAHVGSWFDADGDGEPEKVYYNGWRAHEHILGPGDRLLADCGCAEGASKALALGIENFATSALQGRGVLVDLAAHTNHDGHHPRVAVDHARLMQILQADGVVVEPGDILLLHTGFAEVLLAMQREPDGERLHASGAVLDGRDPALLQWISDSGVAAICADNYAVEAYPARDVPGERAALPLHEHCLFKLGVPLGELWWLGELATWLRAHGRSRCLLTAPPLRLPGAVGSPVTPVATV